MNKDGREGCLALDYTDTGCYAAAKLKTSNIDRLAKEGMRFTGAHLPRHSARRCGRLTVWLPTARGAMSQKRTFKNAALQAVFGGKKQVSMFEMTKLVSKNVT